MCGVDLSGDHDTWTIPTWAYLKTDIGSTLVVTFRCKEEMMRLTGTQMKRDGERKTGVIRIANPRR